MQEQSTSTLSALTEVVERGYANNIVHRQRVFHSLDLDHAKNTREFDRLVCRDIEDYRNTETLHGRRACAVPILNNMATLDGYRWRFEEQNSNYLAQVDLFKFEQESNLVVDPRTATAEDRLHNITTRASFDRNFYEGWKAKALFDTEDLNNIPAGHHVERDAFDAIRRSMVISSDYRDSIVNNTVLASRLQECGGIPEATSATTKGPRL
jgi:hypothetical protein